MSRTAGRIHGGRSRPGHGGEADGRTTAWRQVIPTVAAVLAVVVGSLAAVGVAPAGASSPADQGVTASTINVGFPYVDFAALRSVGITLQESSYTDAYGAMVDYVNAHGGVDGRKIVPYFVEMDPVVASSEDASCAQLTSDDKVFIVLSPVYPECYQVDHDTPTIAGSLPGVLPATAAPDFSLSPPASAYDPLQLAAFAKRGVFKGKKVGIFYGSTADRPEVGIVQAALKKLHVNVAVTAEDSVPESDEVASDQQIQTIAQRFESSGVNLVIGVSGAGSTGWLGGLLANQSTYDPPFIATSESTLASYVESIKGSDKYLDNILTSTPVPSPYQQWQDPAMHTCATIIHKAYPTDTVMPPVNPTSPQASASSTNATYVAVEYACQDLAMLTKLADAAGKHLTVASLTKASYGLKNVTFPGSGGPVSFGPNQPYALGSVNVVTYDPQTASLVPASSRSKT
jgi:Periplasmic binding protein